METLLEPAQKRVDETEAPAAVPNPEALFEEARRRQRRRRLSLVAFMLAAAGACAAYMAVQFGAGPARTHPRPPGITATHQSPIRVTLSAHTRHPSASKSPYVKWAYCVRVTTTAGKTPPSRIHLLLQILSGGTSKVGVGEVWLNKGYDNWCGQIGGEANPLLGVLGKRLVFQAVVTAMGVTIKRNWSIIIR